MRIEGEKDGLAEVGQAVLRVASSRATLPVLSGIKIATGEGEVEFSATDLEMFVSFSSELSVVEPGAVVVPGRLFGEILRSLPDGKVTITGTGGEVHIEGGSTEFSLSAYAVADFPEPPRIEGSAVTRVAGGDLAKALRQVVRAASLDEARPVLTGVLWSLEGGALRLVSTDSYRLAVRELLVKEGSSDGRAIVPGRALAEFGRHLAGVGSGEAEVALGENQASLTAGKSRLVTRLIEGEFPNYRQLIPESMSNRLVAARDTLKEAVERVGLVAQANTPVRLHLGEEVRLTAAETGIGEASESLSDAVYTGEEMVIAFNPRFLGDGLDGVETEKAVLEVADALKPGVIKSDGVDDYLYLVMPVRLAR